MSWAAGRRPGGQFRIAPHGRPLPRTGWISASKSSRLTTAWHLVVERRARRLLVYRYGRRVRTYRVIVGKPSTPTPRGAFFVEENVRLPWSALGAPFALASSARSSVFQEFDGGPGQIALHGVANVGGRLGTAASNGCIRMSGGSITWLASRIGPGVPITIR